MAKTTENRPFEVGDIVKTIEETTCEILSIENRGDIDYPTYYIVQGAERRWQAPQLTLVTPSVNSRLNKIEKMLIYLYENAKQNLGEEPNTH